jgi:hypothetical protein
MGKKRPRLLQFRHDSQISNEGDVLWPAVIKTLEVQTVPQPGLDEFLADLAVSLWSLKQADSSSTRTA